LYQLWTFGRKPSNSYFHPCEIQNALSDINRDVLSGIKMLNNGQPRRQWTAANFKKRVCWQQSATSRKKFEIADARPIDRESPSHLQGPLSPFVDNFLQIQNIKKGGCQGKSCIMTGAR
jgi:hypothetical protein